MTADLTRILVFTAIPVAATLVGGTAAAYRPPSERLQSFFQHFAAGVVLAAVAGEVLPEIDKLHDSLGIVLGFGLGVVLLLGLEGFLRGYEAAESTPARGFPTALVTIVTVDVFVDGLLMGSSFGAGERVGLLVTAALTVELLFLGLSMAAAMVGGGAAPRTVVAATGLIAAALALGGLIGGAFLAGLTGFWLELVLSFGAAALLYLVVEELLTEAHRVAETPLLTASFFVGFLAFYLFELFAA
ncbi:MAG: hypothetical protein K6T57_05980 [Thermaceae bacterium]|nr:hypothetical protein [Thermaceae bacterium]